MSNEIKFDADILLDSVNAHGADGHVYNDTKNASLMALKYIHHQ
ncbi:hypothetical protein [Providencia rettgeri]|nr:hypothetical protein [Providencia rettgeri]BBU96293.1 hypothetical protein BML2496_21760 [Providencia rettgeri]